MASKTLASIGLLLCFNLVFFTMVTSTPVPCPPPPPPKTPCDCHHGGKSPPLPPPTPTPTPTPPTPTPTPVPSKGKCPINALKLGVCANLLGDLLHLVVGSPQKTSCCPLIQGLADTEAAVCLCTAIKADVLGIKLDVPLSLNLLLNSCGKKVPSGFNCP